MRTLKSVSNTTVSFPDPAIASALGRSAGSTTVAPNARSTSSAPSNTVFTYASFPVTVSFRNTARGTPIRFPASAPRSSART